MAHSPEPTKIWQRQSNIENYAFSVVFALKKNDNFVAISVKVMVGVPREVLFYTLSIVNEGIRIKGIGFIEASVGDGEET